MALESLQFQRVLFGVFPTYRASPLRPGFDRMVQARVPNPAQTQKAAAGDRGASSAREATAGDRGGRGASCAHGASSAPVAPVRTAEGRADPASRFMVEAGLHPECWLAWLQGAQATRAQRPKPGPKPGPNPGPQPRTPENFKPFIGKSNAHILSPAP